MSETGEASAGGSVGAAETGRMECVSAVATGRQEQRGSSAKRRAAGGGALPAPREENSQRQASQVLTHPQISLRNRHGYVS